MKKWALILFICLYPTYQSLPQDWSWQNPVPTSNSLYSIKFYNDSIAYCTGDGGFLMKSTDAGLTWESINSNTTLFLDDIFFIDEYNFIAAGYGGTIIKSLDGGISWYRVISGTWYNLTDIFFINTDVGWIAGRGTILKTTDGGNSWSEISQTWFVDLTAVHFYDLNFGIVIGYGATMYTTTDGGINWTNLNTGYSGFRDMFVRSQMEFFVVGDHGLIIKTTDSGNTWNQIYSGTNKSIRSIDFKDENNGIAVGVDGIILITNDGGENWMNISNQYSDTDDLYSTNINSNGFALSAGRTGKLIRSTDCGVTWNSIRQGYLNKLNSIYMLNKMEGWVVGNAGLILRTTDGGKNWEKADSITSVNLYDLLFITDSIGWIVGDIGTVYKTNNRGHSWEQVDQFGSIKIYSIFFINENMGWIAGGNGSIFNTINAGNLWTQQITHTNHNIISIFFSDENYGWCTQSHDVAPILYTTDGGYNWESTINFYGLKYSVFFTDSIRGWVVGGGTEYSNLDYGKVFKTTNGGFTWEEYLYGYAGEWGYRFFDVHFLDFQRGWIFGRILADGGMHREGVIAYTMDGGENLIFQRSNTANPLVSASIVDERHIWVVGDKGTILQSDSSHIITQSVEEDIITISNFLLSQNYPNPFNPSTTINYQIPELSFVTLKVYDVLGNKIETLVNEEKHIGTHTIEFNASSLPSGIYFYQLQTPNFTQTKKMILLK